MIDFRKLFSSLDDFRWATVGSVVVGHWLPANDCRRVRFASRTAGNRCLSACATIDCKVGCVGHKFGGRGANRALRAEGGESPAKEE